MGGNVAFQEPDRRHDRDHDQHDCARPVASAAIAIAAVGAVTILGAWFFQYGLGLMPCPLCLEQRYAYYFAIPLAVMVALGDQVGASRKVLIAALVAIALGMLWNAGLGVYHSGVEWKWWPGPQECSGALEGFGSAGGLLERSVDHRGALRRGRLAVSRALARGLQRADLARARGDSGVGGGDGVARPITSDLNLCAFFFRFCGYYIDYITKMIYELPCLAHRGASSGDGP